MLIDNKADRYSGADSEDHPKIITVWDFLDTYSGKKSGELGKFDIVTGYFTINTLSKLYEELPEENHYRIISSEMVGDDYKKDVIVNLLSDDMDITSIGNLDKQAKQAIAFLERETVEMRAEIVRLHHRLGTTMIYVTHDQTEAMTMGERIVVMNGGRIQQASPPMEVYDHPTNPFVASFIGTPPMNLLPPGVFDLGRITGLRPEHLRVAARTGAPGELDATVDIIETLGAETIVHVVLDGRHLPVIIRVPGTCPFAHGDKVALLADLSKAVYFTR